MLSTGSFVTRSMKIFGLRALSPRRKRYPVALYLSFEPVSRLKAQLLPDGTGQDNRPFRRKLRFHGKTILPLSDSKGEPSGDNRNAPRALCCAYLTRIARRLAHALCIVQRALPHAKIIPSHGPVAQVARARP